MGLASFFVGAGHPAVLLAEQHPGMPELELQRAALARSRSWPFDPWHICDILISCVQIPGSSSIGSWTCPCPFPCRHCRVDSPYSLTTSELVQLVYFPHQTLMHHQILSAFCPCSSALLLHFVHLGFVNPVPFHRNGKTDVLCRALL